MTSIKDKVLVDINVGGHTYTSSLSTLTKYPDSQLGKTFEESIPVMVYKKNNSHFIDRDERLFCYVLNFLRIGELCLPDSFDEFDLLLKECQYYGIKQLTETVKELREKKKEKTLNVTGNSNEVSTTAISHYKRGPTERKYDCVILDIMRSGNEKIYITASKDVIIEIFPEESAKVNRSYRPICSTIGDYILRLPLNDPNAYLKSLRDFSTLDFKYCQEVKALVNRALRIGTSYHEVCNSNSFHVVGETEIIP